ncbi:MAG: hypothetical protein IPM24_04900 [Bryobacterales bacterium]|jgi:methyl-accepting chemotaxis protein|nr:hypothetical protein [Bryobacterales bacterium]
MSEATFRLIVSIGVILVTISAIAQGVVMFLLYRASQVTRARLDQLTQKVEPVIANSRQISEDLRPKLNGILEHTLAISKMAREQAERYDVLLTETAGRARVHVERYDAVLGETAARVEETSALVHEQIMRPVREVNAVMAGVRTAVNVWARGQRPSPEHATQDEEMFI